MGTDTNKPHRYAAFISYAHADEVMAARLHKALETYAVPRHLRAQGKTTKPVFRDVAELTAAHSLSEKIRDAVTGSRVLIVLCSPAAKASHWVNEEIRLFRKLHGDASILSAIIDGTPETAFPDALIEDGREPLAAALGSDKTGFRLGVTQLAAGMLGTGLDDLVQRESKRRNRLMGTGLAASIALSSVLGFTTLQAVEARNEAELERSESEALLEYMVKDLKVKLKPVGRLELLEGVGRKAIEYYDKKDIADLSDDNLRLLAAARQVIAQVALDAGRMEEAQSEIEAAAALTREVLARSPDDTDAIYAHAQSEFWVGEYYSLQNKYDAVEKPWTEYNRLGQLLYQKKPDNFEYIMEAAWGANNLGIFHVKRNEFEASIKRLDDALNLFNLAQKSQPENLSVHYAKADTLSWKADALKRFGTIQTALNVREAQINHIREHPEFKNNFDIQFQYAEALFLYTRLAALKLNGENVNKDFGGVIEGLTDLTRHDPENITWQLTLIRIYIDYYFYTESEITKNNLINKIKALPSVILNSDKKSKRLEFFYTDLIQSKHANSINANPQHISNLIERWNTAFPEGSEDNWIVQSELMNFNEMSKLSAAQVTDFYSTDFNSIEPRYIQRLITAHLILGQCSAAIQKAKVLESRGYKSPSLLTCEG